MMTDPIADMLTRIRHGIAARKRRVEVPASKTKRCNTFSSWRTLPGQE